MIGIYKIENKINHKKYIGQSVDIKRRWQNEKTNAFNINAHEYEYPLSRAFRKYGVDNFIFEVIEECPQSQLNERETYWIQKYDSFFNGYNQTLGGDTAKGSQPKEKIIGVFNDLKTTDLIHAEIAKKWDISIEMVQGINTGRYWHQDDIEYPIQERCKIIKAKRGQRKKKKYCQQCGKEISQKATLCTDCYAKSQRRVNRPTREELKKLIRTTPFIQIGKMFNVSDNSIRKWCDDYNLPRKVTEIKKYSDREWSKI